MSDGWGEPVQINRRPQSKMAFSDYEKEQLRESIGFLTLAFALALSNGLLVVMDDPSILITTLPLAFAAVMTGFLLHELAHKWMAQQYGCWAEYRGNKNGLYFALAMSAFGFLLAAPGAVMVSGRITDRQNGIIAAVGPLTNIAIAIVALPIYIFTAGLDWPISLIHNCNKSYTRRIQHDTHTTSGWIQGHNVEQTCISRHNRSNLRTGDGLLEYLVLG